MSRVKVVNLHGKTQQKGYDTNNTWNDSEGRLPLVPSETKDVDDPPSKKNHICCVFKVSVRSKYRVRSVGRSNYTCGSQRH